MIPLLLISSVSGALWGMLGYWMVVDTNWRDVAWIGLVASPFIGVAIGMMAARCEPQTLKGQIGFSLLGLYAAVALFGVVLAAGEIQSLTLAVPRRLISGAIDSMTAMTAYGAVLILWPLSVANHLVIWSRPRS